MLRPSPASEVACHSKEKSFEFPSVFVCGGPCSALIMGGSFHQVRRRLSRRPVLEDSDMDEAKVMRVCV